nr:MAG TPA: hypothetical protein [Crassvirales sp.]
MERKLKEKVEKVVNNEQIPTVKERIDIFI